MYCNKSQLINCLVKSFLIGGLAGLLVSVPVMAQKKGVLEEVIVTAQKREQSLSSVGISITAFSGEQVHEFGFTNTVDITEMTPGLNYTVPNAEGSQINFFLRGVGLNDYEDVNENPVGAYFDEVYRGAMGGLDLQLFDMERIEVLRGPQGTLYGRNTTGGLINFISRKPTDKFTGYGELSGGSYDQIKFEGAVSGPLVPDKLLGRLSIATNNASGYTKNRFPGVGDFNETNSVAARGQLLWKPADNVQILTKLHWSRNHGQVGAWQHQTSVATDGGDNRRTVGPTEDLFGAGAGNDAFGYSDTDGDPHAGDYNRNGKVKVKADGASANLSWDLNDNLTLVNIGAYDHTDRWQAEDTDAGPNPFIEPTFNAKTKQYTEELRLHGNYDKWRWVTGFYYYNQKVDGHYTLDLSNLGFVYFNANFNQDTESWALFGQSEYDLTPNWTFIAGLRYTEETKNIDYRNVDTTGLYEAATLGLIPPAAFGLTVPPPITPERPTPDSAFVFNRQSVGDLAVQDHNNISGKVELDWKPSDDLLVYASFSRGKKSAGFNTGFMDETYIFASNTVNTIPFGQETLDAYEIGFKSTVMDDKVRLNGAAFYYDYKHFQTFRFELLNAIIFNTNARVYGGELELQASPWEGWDFMLGLSLLDAIAKDIPAAASGVPHNRNMVAAPDVTFNGLARYEWPIFGGTGAIQFKFHYQDKTYYDVQNYDNAKENGYVIGDIRAQWTSPDEHWQVAAFANNVWDEEYITYTFDFAIFGFNQVAYGKPRWVGGNVRYSW